MLASIYGHWFLYHKGMVFLLLIELSIGGKYILYFKIAV